MTHFRCAHRSSLWWPGIQSADKDRTFGGCDGWRQRGGGEGLGGARPWEGARWCGGGISHLNRLKVSYFTVFLSLPKIVVRTSEHWNKGELNEWNRWTVRKSSHTRASKFIMTPQNFCFGCINSTLTLTLNVLLQHRSARSLTVQTLRLKIRVFKQMVV